MIKEGSKMSSRYFVFAKYSDDNRIVLNCTMGNYSEAKKVVDYLEQLGHTADIFELDCYFRK